MAVAFTRFSFWIWGGKDQESPNSPLNSSDLLSGFKELDCLRFPPVNGPARSNSRRIKKKWQSREERRIDKEYDIVLVPSDGGCISGSESDDSDWSIGWLEPHGPEFENDTQTENSFAVLVQCYGRGQSEQAKNSRSRFLGASHHIEDDISGPVKNESSRDRCMPPLIGCGFRFGVRRCSYELFSAGLLLPSFLTP
ncbi:uncharacterized protein LOC121970671 isoform X1 [Zingiber officinale]|uniref:Uncharacterized protein n=1 Tax=Zingiber officinale TaxID=94328 RepID=A0A8J5LJT3_ZINOF|nr:uncharacterized protein LOC121970671 isoform X1 [Zingiber officinale]XP_042377456.1 uncharacterized protein LOC121970671 isoform X1 [Zingiber officinale]XP_042377457.1 uncharacterized protein LOC121970671 isoform X1 [Zingiber officinale]XP_042377458.1 uncharacterized protein LOC121970671 isoform X1 [Zingiber officinale]KAG6515058.1 hypothetical protein ZIOFF_025437 [Zingiber officinale]